MATHNDHVTAALANPDHWQSANLVDRSEEKERRHAEAVESINSALGRGKALRDLIVSAAPETPTTTEGNS